MATTITIIDACARARVPVLLTSDPGTGKTSLVRSLADSRGVPFEAVLGSIREPSDIAGLPVVSDDGVFLHPPAWAKRLHKEEKGVLLLDELSTCPPAVQAALLQVLLERVVGDLRLPRDVIVVAAANPPDRAADGWALAPPLANRLCHVTFDPDPDEFIHGLATGWSAMPASRAIAASLERVAASRASVASYLSASRHMIHRFPGTTDQAAGPWPSRRTWEMTAKSLAFLRDDDDAARHAVAFGLVGDGAEYLTWARNADLPDPEDVLADPDSVQWKTERPDKVWAILSGVIAHCTAGKVTKEGWRKAWLPLVSAAKAGAVDSAAAASRPLILARPDGASPPAAAKAFIEYMREAGLMNSPGPTAAPVPAPDREPEAGP